MKLWSLMLHSFEQFRGEAIYHTRNKLDASFEVNNEYLNLFNICEA